MGDSGNSVKLYFFGLQNHCRWWLQPWNEKMLAPGRKVMTNLDSILKSRDITSSTKVHLVKANGFSSGHVWMWELDCEESWVPKNWCFWTVVWRRLLRVPWTARRSSMFIGRTDAEAETPILWPPDAKNWLIGKDPDAGKDWRQEEKRVTENEVVGWHHWVNGHESG